MAWMRANHADLWIGMARMVGNRSLVYHRNAMVAYYMLPFYLRYIDYCTSQVWVRVCT